MPSLPDAPLGAVLDPKPADDPSWSDGGWAPAPVTAVAPRFGEHHDGGGPAGLWYRLTASHDPAQTARRFAAALRLVQAGGPHRAGHSMTTTNCAGHGPPGPD